MTLTWLSIQLFVCLCIVLYGKLVERETWHFWIGAVIGTVIDFGLRLFVR